MANKRDTSRLDSIQKKVMAELDKEATNFGFINELNNTRNDILYQIHKKEMVKRRRQARK